MKRIVFVLIFLVIITYACKPKTTGVFVVSGKIEHVPPQKVFLQELPLDGTQPVILDSGTLSSSGAFELHTIAKQQGLYFVGVQDGPDAIFINDNDKINIQLDANNFRHPQIEGSEASKSLYNFIDTYIQNDSAVRVTYYKIDSLQNQPGNDSVLRVLQLQGEQQINTLNNYVKSFVNETASPAAAHFAITQAIRTQVMQEEDLLALTTAAADKFKNNEGLAFLKSRLTVQIAGAISPLINKPAPDLTMPNADGKPVSISNFRGKYLLVDFWASWCGPCRRENPNVVATYNKFKDKNFTILGVSLDNDKAAWLEAIKKDGLVWNHMSDLKQWESTAVSTYKFDGIPFNVLIDPQGKIVASNLTGDALENKLAEVLK